MHAGEWLVEKPFDSDSLTPEAKAQNTKHKNTKPKAAKCKKSPV